VQDERRKRHGGSNVVVPMMEKSHWAAGVLHNMLT
jgi:hypothetical protein